MTLSRRGLFGRAAALVTALVVSRVPEVTASPVGGFTPREGPTTIEAMRGTAYVDPTAAQGAIDALNRRIIMLSTPEGPSQFFGGARGGSLRVVESQAQRMHAKMARAGLQMTELSPVTDGLIEVDIRPFAALDRGAGIHIPPEQQTDWIVAEIYAAAERYGVSGDWLLSVAMCESNLDPNAVNPVTGDTGLFQFNPSTWAAWGGGNIWSVYEQADKAAWAFSQGLSSHWVCA